MSLKLNPSRPDFAQTTTDEERSIMQQQAAYRKNYMDQGKVVVFGPVLHPNAVYGLGVLAINDEQEVNDFIAGDPANKINSYEYPMLDVLPGN
ncbi:MAG TPA: YciI family protein [Flavisolibacter sp.]|nr:YciI family protein [Flavisolibacter sp.]